MRVRQLDAEHRHARLSLLRELFGLDEQPAAAERRARAARSARCGAAARVDAPAGRHPRKRAGAGPGALGGRAARRDAEIVEITTSGDQARGVGDKSRWVDTIEAALVAGEIDLAVHSAKDVPGELAEGCELAATPPRAAPQDVLVRRRRFAAERSASALPEGARVGTSSLRRRAQLLSVRPDLEVVELRGQRRHAAAQARRGRGGRGRARRRRARAARRRARPARRSTSCPAPGQGTLALETGPAMTRARRRSSDVMTTRHLRGPARRAGRRARIGSQLSHTRGNPRARRHDSRVRRACPTAPRGSPTRWPARTARSSRGGCSAARRRASCCAQAEAMAWARNVFLVGAGPGRSRACSRSARSSCSARPTSSSTTG